MTPNLHPLDLAIPLDERWGRSENIPITNALGLKGERVAQDDPAKGSQWSR